MKHVSLLLDRTKTSITRDKYIYEYHLHDGFLILAITNSKNLNHLIDFLKGITEPMDHANNYKKILIQKIREQYPEDLI